MVPPVNFLLLTLAFSFTAVLAASANFKLRGSILPPHGWQRRGVPPPDHTITLRIGLPQHNFPLLEKHLYEVSDPNHARYGAHFTKGEVEALVAPHPESLAAIDAWLASYGLTEDSFTRSPAKDWVKLTIPIALAEEMLNAKYHVWEHDESGDVIVRTMSYSLPQYLDGHVDVIQPTTMFTQFKRMRSTINTIQDYVSEEEPSGTVQTASGLCVDARCNSTITITCLQQLYNAVGFAPSASNNNNIGITGYLEEYANIQDLQLFYADQRPDALNSTFNFISVKGGLNDQNPTKAGGEANLDTQFAFGLSHPIPASTYDRLLPSGTFYSTAGHPPFKPDALEPQNLNEPYLDWLEFVQSQDTVPLVISSSYGDDEQTVPVDYAKRVCAEFAQLGLRGVSLLVSSGDGGVGDGVSDPAKQQCFTNDGKNRTEFNPAFPASCPFVTSVGATRSISPEVSAGFSGGGFSNYFARPSYQDIPVQEYLSKLPAGTYKGLFNPAGRAYPDVSAQGENFRVFVSGKVQLIGGTSASSPSFAGIVALLNDVRLAQHLPPLGFLNPFLYGVSGSHKTGLNDITAGNNPGCGTPGFNATEGWDPVTGLGTPDFGALRQRVLGN